MSHSFVLCCMMVGIVGVFGTRAAQSGVYEPGADNTVMVCKVQKDGKIVLGGDFTHIYGFERNRIALLNPDGTLDASFNPGNGANNTVRAIAIQNDGKLIIGGMFTEYNGVGCTHIVRLNTDGSLDTSFNANAPSNKWVSDIAVDSDGYVLVAGEYTIPKYHMTKQLVRLKSDGTTDTAFNEVKLYRDYSVRKVVSLGNGEILISGYEIYARLSHDGSIVQTMISGSACDTNIVIQPDNKILSIINAWFAVSTSIFRSNIDGSSDIGFNNIQINGMLDTSTGIQGDGKILAAMGYPTLSVNPILRFNSDGTSDSTFKSEIGASSCVESMAIQSDNKIILGGDFTTVNGTERHRFTRLNADGSLDRSFILLNASKNWSMYQ